MTDMAKFVRQHAGDFVGIFRPRQQPIEQKDLAAGQRECVGNGRRQHCGLGRQIHPGGAANGVHELGEGSLSRRIVAVVGAEQRPDLPGVAAIPAAALL